jgi:hypothetical protein
MYVLAIAGAAVVYLVVHVLYFMLRSSGARAEMDAAVLPPRWWTRRAGGSSFKFYSTFLQIILPIGEELV